MAATTICVPSPTLTSSSVSTSQSVFTTTTLSTSTLPEQLSTTLVTFTTCTPTNSTSICVPTSTNSIVTLPANFTTLTVAVTSTSDILSTSFTTLFGSSCVTSVISTPGKETSTPIVTPPTSLPTSAPTNPINTNTSSSTSSISSTTTSSTGAPVDTGSGATIQHDNKGGGGGGTNVGPIVGGVVGGVAALLIVGFITWKLIKKQSRFDDIFNTDRKPHYQKKSSIRIPEPKPYDYGLVGSHAAPTSHSSHPTSFTPPSSPPPTQGTFNNIGPDPFAGPSGSYHPVPGQDIGPQLQPNPQANVPNVNHLRNPSLAPLLAGVGVAVGAGAGVAAAVPSRPSSTASTSTTPGPLVTNAIPGQSPAFISNTIPPTTYPPTMQNWNSNQTHTGGSSSVNTQGYGSGPSMSGPSSSLSHNPSANSSLSMYATPPGIVPLPVGAASASRPQQQQQYEDPFARTGSPVSFQENRVLQVRNATRSDSLRTTGRASGVRESGIYDPNAYYLAGSAPGGTAAAGASSSGTTTGNTTSGTTAAGASSSRNEKQQLVHLDGSLFQERPPGTPAPPAYAE